MSSTPSVAPQPIEPLLRTKEACALLGVSPALLRKLVRGGLPVVRLGRRRLYRPRDLRTLVAQRRHAEGGRP